VDAELITSADQAGRFPPEELPEIAFLGRSNVGKSSLLNSLLERKDLAFTSSTPGRTQAINFYRVGDRFQFVDLPGYGFARVPLETRKAWKRLIEAYLLGRKSLELCVFLLDARRGWMEKDLELKRWLEFHARPFLVAATKIDKLNQKEKHRGLDGIRQMLAGAEPVPCSAVTGEGVRQLWQAIQSIRKTST
jgi:GTP-binding protein